jgi:hypothetical protein
MNADFVHELISLTAKRALQLSLTERRAEVTAAGFRGSRRSQAWAKIQLLSQELPKRMLLD